MTAPKPKWVDDLLSRAERQCRVVKLDKETLVAMGEEAARLYLLWCPRDRGKAMVRELERMGVTMSEEERRCIRAAAATVWA